MKNTCLICLIFFSPLSFTIFAQDYSKTDSIVDTYPKFYLHPNNLSQRINRDFTDPSERARAAYAWIAKNITYDLSSLHSVNKRRTIRYSSKSQKASKENRLQNRLVKRTLRKRRAICYGYAVLYKKLCDLSEVPCEIIAGGDKTKCTQIGRNPSFKSHAWNAVRINDTWKLVDVTWGAGSVDPKKKAFFPEYTDIYFFLSPDRFYLNHFPKDTSWVLIHKTKDDFVRLPLYYTNYLATGNKIITPSNGVISIAPQDTICLKFSKAPNLHSISYQFSKFQYQPGKPSYEAEPEIFRTAYCDFKIVNDLATDGYLTIFAESKPLVTYKLVLIK